MLTLDLVSVPNVLGIYGKTKKEFPASMSKLHPEAAAAYAEVCNTLVVLKVSDMYRTAEQSLIAMKAKTGVQPPGFSAHNYGLAIDIDVDYCLKTAKMAKDIFDINMLSKGWWCHRKDGKRGFEDWHYTYLGVGSAAAPFTSLSEDDKNIGKATEAKIMSVYGKQFKLSATDLQTCLSALGMYSGAIDGKVGPRTGAAISAFQRAWRLPDTGKMDTKTERTLALVSANKQVK